MSIRIALVALVAMAATAVAVPASAEAETIAFDRAALADPGAVQALRARIADAAERACRRENDRLAVLGPTVRRRAVEACVVELVEAAERQAGLFSLPR